MASSHARRHLLPLGGYRCDRSDTDGIDCRAWATSSLDSATRVELRRARARDRRRCGDPGDGPLADVPERFLIALDRRTIRRGRRLPRETDRAGPIDHVVSSELRHLWPFTVSSRPSAREPTAEERPGVGENGPRRKKRKEGRLPETVRVIEITTRIGDERPLLRKRLGQSRQDVRRLEGDDHDLAIYAVPKLLRLLQLQQVISSGDSHQVTEEDEERVPLGVRHDHLAPGEIRSREGSARAPFPTRVAAHEESSRP